jgi:hypothetical protein
MATAGTDIRTMHCQQAGATASAALLASTPWRAAARLTATAMAAPLGRSCSLAAAVLLTLAAPAVAPAAAQNTTANGVTTGLSALTIKNYPLPPAFKCAASAWACVTQAARSSLL